MEDKQFKELKAGQIAIALLILSITFWVIINILAITAIKQEKYFLLIPITLLFSVMIYSLVVFIKNQKKELGMDIVLIQSKNKKNG